METSIFCETSIFLKIKKLFLKRGKGEKERERNINMRNINQLRLARAPTRDRTHNPGVHPDWNRTQRPVTLWDDAQPTEPHWSGLKHF